jgi:hypothetical protein
MTMIEEFLAKMATAFKVDPTLYIYVVVGIIAAILLYICRTYRQTAYGFLEIVVGLGLLLLSIQLIGGGFGSGFSNDFQTAQITISATTYLGAIFVMVRGFDNIRQGLASTKTLNRNLEERNMPRLSQDDLVQIIANRGDLDLKVGTRNQQDLLQLAAIASKSDARIVLRELAVKSAADLVQIAATAPGKITFVIE